MKETRDLWDAWSDDFQAAWNADTAEGELPPADVHVGPGVSEDERFDLLPHFEGADVAELGCGGGQASVGFACRGAESVVGVDFSPGQLEHAERLAALYGVDVDFLAGDVTELPLADGPDRYREQWSHKPDLMAKVPPTLAFRAVVEN